MFSYKKLKIQSTVCVVLLLFLCVLGSLSISCTSKEERHYNGRYKCNLGTSLIKLNPIYCDSYEVLPIDRNNIRYKFYRKDILLLDAVVPNSYCLICGSTEQLQ